MQVTNVANHLRQNLATPDSAPPAPTDISSPADVVLAYAKKKAEDGAYSEAGAAYARVLEKVLCACVCVFGEGGAGGVMFCV